MSKGPRNGNKALIDKAVADAQARVEGWEPGVPAQDPVPQAVEQPEYPERGDPGPRPSPGFSIADIFNYHYTTIEPAVIGWPNGARSISNTTEKGHMRQKLVEVALRMTELYLSRVQPHPVATEEQVSE